MPNSLLSLSVCLDFGARGLEAERTCAGTISGTTGMLGAPAFTYPVYDSHGNRIATLQRGASTGTYTVGSIRYYGAWGEIRVGAANGGSNSRYCANLGHLQDDESGLVYMRSRYYEISSGRFVSEDGKRNGLNWYFYYENRPTTGGDLTGGSPESDQLMFYGAVLKLVGMLLMGGGVSLEYACFPWGVQQILDLAGDIDGINKLAQAIGDLTGEYGNKAEQTALQAFIENSQVLRDALLYGKESFWAPRTMIGSAIVALLGYDMVFQGELLQMDADAAG